MKVDKIVLVISIMFTSNSLVIKQFFDINYLQYYTKDKIHEYVKFAVTIKYIHTYNYYFFMIRQLSHGTQNIKLTERLLPPSSNIIT